MLQAMLALAFSALPAQDDAEAAAAVQKLLDAKSYAFKVETKTDSSGGFGGGERGGERTGPQTAKSEGKFQKDAGTWILTEQMEYVRIGKTTAARPRAEWRVLEESSQGGRERGRGGFMRGGGTPRASHEELADFGKKISKCKKIEAVEEGCTVYEAVLTDEAAREFNPAGRMLERMGGGEVTGKAKLWVRDGAVMKYQITTKIEGDVQGNAFEMTQSKTVAISGVDETVVEIPEAAKKLIDKSRKADY